MAGTIHAIQLTYYSPEELRPVLKVGQHLIEHTTGIVHVAIPHPEGMTIRRIGAHRIEEPVFLRWTDSIYAFAIVEILPCDIQAGVIMRSDP